MNIAVLDDEKLHLDHLCSLVRSLAREGDNIFAYSSAEALLFDWFPGKFDLLLLDIQMPGDNGLSLAKQIREYGDDSAIIFITAVSDYVFDGYDVGASQYLLKPVDKAKLVRCIDSARNAHSESKKLIFETDRGINAFEIKEIFYLEAVSHKTKITTRSDEITVNESISSVSERLPEYFFKCHRSYIVNLGHVSSIRQYETVLDNGAVVPVSRRLYREYNMRFIEFYRRKL